ncbi:MAG: hypothetical protein WDW36_009267 [Sanguina aurantia]
MKTARTSVLAMLVMLGLLTACAVEGSQQPRLHVPISLFALSGRVGGAHNTEPASTLQGTSKQQGETMDHPTEVTPGTKTTGAMPKRPCATHSTVAF